MVDIAAAADVDTYYSDRFVFAAAVAPVAAADSDCRIDWASVWPVAWSETEWAACFAAEAVFAVAVAVAAVLAVAWWPTKWMTWMRKKRTWTMMTMWTEWSRGWSREFRSSSS